jgi:hypothetical protein
MTRRRGRSCGGSADSFEIVDAMIGGDTIYTTATHAGQRSRNKVNIPVADEVKTADADGNGV